MSLDEATFRADDRTSPYSDDGTGKTQPALILDPSDPYKSAARYLELHHSHQDGRTLQRHRGSFYAWMGTDYREVQLEEIRTGSYRFMEAAQAWRPAKDKKAGPVLGPFKPNRRHVSDFVDALQARAFIRDDLAMPCWLGPRETRGTVIPLANGLLDLATGHLHRHSPRYFQSYSLPFDFDPLAPEPVAWLDFLSTLWPDDEEARDALQEIMGLLLTDDTLHQKLFMLVGPPRSGKGTIARIIQTLLGRENVAGPTLSGLAMNFGLQELIGKPVAVISDARLSGRSDAAVIAERLLSISGEDCLTIDRKHRAPWTGTLPTRFLILTNELPRIADSSGALASRFVILMLRRSFLGKEDHKLTGKLTAELPGIFNWALMGRARLEQRGFFITPQSSQEAVDELQKQSSPILAFLSERCIKGPAVMVECNLLYENWRSWCYQQGRDQPGTLQAFGVQLRSALPDLKVPKPRGSDGKQHRHYQGVRLRTEHDPDDAS